MEGPRQQARQAPSRARCASSAATRRDTVSKVGNDPSFRAPRNHAPKPGVRGPTSTNPHMGDLFPLIVVGGGFALVGSVLYGAWSLGRYRGRDEELPRDLATIEDRLARVENALVHTMGALDRLEAAHRHTARLITENPAISQTRVGRP